MPQRADHPGKAWCFQHEMPPTECFDLHNAKIEKKRALTTEEHNAAIVKRHIRLQAENFRKQAEAAQRKFESLKGD